MTALIILAYLLWGSILPVGMLAGISLWRYSRDKAEGALMPFLKSGCPRGCWDSGSLSTGRSCCWSSVLPFFQKSGPTL